MRQEVLAGLPDRLVDDFINTYCNDKPNQGKPIQVATTFPAQAPTNPFILVQFKQGVEAQDDSSIGNVQGSVYDAQQGNTVVKKLPVHTDKHQAFIELPEPVYGIYHVKEVTDYTFKNNRVYVPYFPFYDDQQHLMTVTYYQKTNKAQADVLPMGIVEQEQVAVDFCATNLDSLRCMVGLLTAISIYLKDTLEANSDIQLPTISTEGTDLVTEFNDPTNSVTGQQLFYRRMTVSFKSLHTLPVGVGEKITNIHTALKLNNGEITYGKD